MAIRKKFSSRRVVEDWNEQPNYVVNSTTVNTFKKNYDTFKASSNVKTRDELVRRAIKHKQVHTWSRLLYSTCELHA